jgi:hypothetical protein
MSLAENLTMIHHLITTFYGGVDSSKRKDASVKEKALVTWQTAVHKMTSAVASSFSFPEPSGS